MRTTKKRMQFLSDDWTGIMELARRSHCWTEKDAEVDRALRRMEARYEALSATAASLAKEIQEANGDYYASLEARNALCDTSVKLERLLERRRDLMDNAPCMQTGAWRWRV